MEKFNSVMLKAGTLLEELGVPYTVVGSIASSRFGMHRATMDVDIVAEIQLSGVHEFVIRETPAFMTREDVLLGKLEWYRAGDETSTQQWNDVLGILRSAPSFDLEYALHWASEIGVDALFTRALQESERV
jgi:hypothetical protein